MQIALIKISDNVKKSGQIGRYCIKEEIKSNILYKISKSCPKINGTISKGKNQIGKLKSSKKRKRKQLNLETLEKT